MSASVDSMFSVRELPWWAGTSEDHGQANIVREYPENWEAARKLAGLDWEQVWAPTAKWTADENGKTRLALPDGTEQKGLWTPDPEWGAIVRSDTGATLSHMKPGSYTSITNSELGQIVEAVLQTDKNIKWETGGSLEGGKLVWILITLDEPVTIAGDKGTWTLPMMAVTNRCDGFGACVLRSTAVRVVCANTFRAAELEGENTGATYKFVHRGKWTDHIDEAREAVTKSRKEFADYQELAKDLLGIKVTANQRELFVRAFIPKPPDGLITDRVSRNVEESREALRAIFASETTEHVKGSVYGLVQGAGEYLDHVRTSRTWETKLNRSILRQEPLKARALRLAKECAAAQITKAELPA